MCVNNNVQQQSGCGQIQPIQQGGCVPPPALILRASTVGGNVTNEFSKCGGSSGQVTFSSLEEAMENWRKFKINNVIFPDGTTVTLFKSPCSV